MNPPKVFWAAVVFAMVVIGAGFFILQSTGFAQAQGKITGTIVLRDQASASDFLAPVSLPGSTCSVKITSCGGPVVFFNAKGNDQGYFKAFIPNELARRSEGFESTTQPFAESTPPGKLQHKASLIYTANTKEEVLNAFGLDDSSKVLDISGNAEGYARQESFYVVAHQPRGYSTTWLGYVVDFSTTAFGCNLFEATLVNSGTYFVAAADMSENNLTPKTIFYSAISYECV